MKRIGNSKEPTPARMSAIAENLEHLLDTYVTVEVRISSHPNLPVRREEYALWISLHAKWREFKTWPELIEAYRQIVRDWKDAS